jgi:hypothetical protein
MKRGILPKVRIMRMFKNSATEKDKRVWIILQDEEPDAFYSSPYIFRKVESRSARCEEHVTRTGRQS